MLFQVTQICFNESDYITIYLITNILSLNARIMVLKYYCLEHVREGLLEAHHDRFCSLVKLLCTYFLLFEPT